MTTVTFIFFILFSRLVSSDTWLRLDCTELSLYGHDEETKGFSSNASYKQAVIYDKTKQAQTCERSPEMKVVLEKIFTQDSIEQGVSLFPGVTLGNMLFDGYVNLLQTVKENVNGAKQCRHVCKFLFQQLLMIFPSKNRTRLFTVEIRADNQSTYLKYRSICPSSVLRGSVAHSSHVLTLVIMNHQKGMGDICICKECKSEERILQGILYRELGPAFPQFLILVLPENQVSLISSVESERTHVRLCYVQMPSKFHAPNCPKEAAVMQADVIKLTVYTCSMGSVRPTDTSRWVARIFLAALLQLGIYMTILKISSHRLSPAYGRNSMLSVVFTITWHCFSPSVNIHQPSEWSCIAVGISFVICTSCALGRSVHVLIACRTAHTVMRLFCNTQQQFRVLPITMLLIWLTFSPPFPNRNIKQWFLDTLDDYTTGSTQRWAVLGQIMILSILCCVFVPTKYVLVIKISRLI